MTDRKSSFLTGLSLANQYAAGNAFKGNAAADFGAMLLFRSATPFDGFGGTTVPRFLCGNLQSPTSSATRGWALLWLAGSQPSGALALVFGDATLAEQEIVAEAAVPASLAQRSMLVHMFMLRDPALTAPDNVTALLYVNGALVARQDGLSQMPADGTGTFRVGGGTVAGATVDAPGIGVSGFGYCSSVPGSTLAAKLATVQAMVDATVASSLATGDVADDALISNLYSVRRGLASPEPLWTPVKGASSLIRVGSSSLSVEAGDPLFSDNAWDSGDSGASILDRLSVAPLAAWWTRRLRSSYPGNSYFADNGDGSRAPIGFNSDGLLNIRGLAALSAQNGGGLDVGALRLYDQALGNDVGPAAVTPRTFVGSTQLPELEGQTPVLNFANVANQFFDRSDALDLAADPGLTIAFKCKLAAFIAGVNFPSLLSLGTAATPEITVYFSTDGVADRLVVGNAADSHDVNWDLPLGSVLAWHSYVIQKPEGAGYANTWKLFVDGVDQGVPVGPAGADPLGATLTRIGDFGAAGGAPGGFPFVGELAGIIVFGQMLDASDRALLQAFLDAQ